MTKNELKDKIKSLVKQVYKPDYLQAQDKISLDAPKFPVLEKFPELKDIIVNLLTNQYEIFVSDIQWVAPKPSFEQQKKDQSMSAYNKLRML